MSDLVCFGEVLWDDYGTQKKIGGAPFNVCAIAKIIEVDSLIITAIGKRKLGQELKSEINRLGVPVILQENSKRTGIAHVKLNKRKQPTFEIDENSAYDHIEFTEDVAEAARKAKIICFGTLAQRKKKSRETLSKILESTSAIVVYDINLREGIKNWKKIVRESLVETDILKVNEKELKEISKMFGLKLSNKDDEKILLEFLTRDFMIKKIFITRGDQGATLYTHEKNIFNFKPHKKKAVDTTGCGDAFTAGIISAILDDFEPKNMLECAVKLASRVALYRGAVPKELE